MDNQKKNVIFNIKQLMKTARGRALLFFGAYLLFFIGIAIIARTGGSSNGTVYNTGESLKFSFSNIENKNYKFTYEIILDDVSYLYAGERTLNNERFVYNNLMEYYSAQNVYFVNNSGIWVNISNPYEFKEFMDIDNISSFVENATYISKTEYDSGRDVYSFKISSATMSKILENKDIDVEEIPNEILIGTETDNYVNEIKLKLDSYCKIKGYCINNMSVSLKYEDFGNINEIISPLE